MRLLQDQLIEKGLSQPRTCEVEQKSIRTREKQSERMTDRELAELMGTNRPRYARKRGGAFTQR